MAISAQKEPIKKEFNFHWKGRDRAGKTVANLMRAGSQAEVRSELLKQGIQPLNIARTRENIGIGGRIRSIDVMLFSRQMSTMMQAGLSISEALGMQVRGLKKISMRTLLLKIKSEVDSGNALSKALNQHPDIFTEMYCGLIFAGENSGTLEVVFTQLANYQEKRQKISSTVKKALVYPSFVITLALAITAAILVFIIPVFQEMFEAAGMELPALTQWVVNISEGLRTGAALYVIVIIGLGIVIFKFFLLKLAAVKRYIAKKTLELPLLGRVIVLGNCATYARTLATMYMAGTPMLFALKAVSNACSNLIFKHAILEIRDNVAIGQQLNFAMAQTHLFPDMVVHMVGIGEKSGNLSDMLFKISEFFEAEVESTVATMMAMIEPILIVILGGLVGGLIVAMYLPIFDLAAGA